MNSAKTTAKLVISIASHEQVELGKPGFRSLCLICSPPSNIHVQMKSTIFSLLSQ